MALGKNTKRIQITLNADKTNDKVILEYLSSCYNENDKIKELLYSIITQQEPQLKTVINSKERLLTINNNEQKKVLESNDESVKKLLTNTNSKQENEKVENNIKPIVTKTNEELQVKPVTNQVTTSDDDFTLDVDLFDDKVVEVKANDELEIIQQNELDELSKFM